MNATRHLAAMLGLVLLLTACGGDGSATTTDDGTDTTSTDTTTDTTDGPGTLPPDDAPQTLLRIDQVGGFAPIELIATYGPDYVLTTDGILYTRAAVPEIFPGPLVTSYLGTDASASVADVLDIVEEMGLPEIDEEIDDEAAGAVADATTTVVTFYDEAGVHSFGVYALGFEEPSDPRGVALQDLILTLDAAATSAGGEVVEYVPDRWQVVLSDPTPTEEGFEDVRSWPLDVTPAEFTEESFTMPCIVLEGAAAEQAGAVFAEATQVTSWDLDGTEHKLLPLALFPGEEGCQAR